MDQNVGTPGPYQLTVCDPLVPLLVAGNGAVPDVDDVGVQQDRGEGRGGEFDH